MKNSFLYIYFLFLLIGSKLYSQSFITGNVFSEDGIKINNVQIFNADTKKNTYTDLDGNFIIEGEIGNQLIFIKTGFERNSVIVNKLLMSVIFLKHIPYDIQEVKINPFSGNIYLDTKRIKINNSKEILEEEIGLPKLKGKQREKIPNVVNDIITPLISTTPTIKIQELYTLISGNGRRMKRLYQYQDTQENIKWLREGIGEEYFLKLGIPLEKINEFLEFAIKTNPGILYSIKTNNINNAIFQLSKSFDIYYLRLYKK